MDILKLRRIFLEICQGFSKTKFQKRDIYFKHLDEIAQNQVDEYEEAWKTRLINLGTRTAAQALAEAYKEKRWTAEQENEFNSISESYRRFCRKLPERFLSVDHIDQHFELREEMRKEIVVAQIPRFAAIGGNAEDSAYHAAKLEEIRLCSFADPEFKVPFFFDFDYLSYQESSELQALYYNQITSIQSDNVKEIKRIAAQHFFCYKFSISENPADFFRKPLWELTQFQTLLLCFGRKFVQYLPYCADAPDHFYEEPDKLEYYSLMVQSNPKKENNVDMATQVQQLNRKMKK